MRNDNSLCCCLVGAIFLFSCPVSCPIVAALTSCDEGDSTTIADSTYACPLGGGCPCCGITCCLCLGCNNKMQDKDVSGYAAVGATCCLMICESKVNFNARYNGSTVLHYAVSETFVYNYMSCYFYTEGCKQGMVSYLLSKGADPAVRNSYGKTPYEVMEKRFVREQDQQALLAGHEKIVEQRRVEEEQRQREQAEKRREAQAARERKLAEMAPAIAELESFLAEDAGIDKERARLQAEKLCMDYSVDSVGKLRVEFVKGSLTTTFFKQTYVEPKDQELISQALFAVQASRPKAWTPPAGGPADDEPVFSDCFLTHDWGTDEFGRSNHERVSRVNRYLKSRGLETWFDEDRMEGNVRRKMTEGIENAQSVVVFITSRYRDKVNGSEERDNCRYEFTYAVEQKGPQSMIPVVMEARMLNARGWKQELGAALGTKLYVNLVSDDAADFDEHCEELYNRIRATIGKTVAERAAEKQKE